MGLTDWRRTQKEEKVLFEEKRTKSFVMNAQNFTLAFAKKELNIQYLKI